MEDQKKTWDKVRKNLEGVIGEEDLIQLGKYYSYTVKGDIKHLAFSFSRYKFASKLLRFQDRFQLLELGCSEGIGAYFFTQMKNCESYLGIDFDSDAIKTAEQSFGDGDKIRYYCADFLQHNEYGRFDAIISMDVIEHIIKEKEMDFVDCLWKNLKDNGIVVVGTPNITMDPYASAGSKIGHVNLFNQKRLYDTLSKRFQNVFIFNMNDEVLHLGFDPMACYMLGVCCGKK